MLDAQAIAKLINRDPEIMGGMPVFRGTRVPIKTMFDHLEHGYTIEGFLEQFPSVQREQAVAVLELGKDLLVAEVGAVTKPDHTIRAMIDGLQHSESEVRRWAAIALGKTGDQRA